MDVCPTRLLLAHAYGTVSMCVALSAYSTISIATVSTAYQDIKLKGYDLLEERNKELVRKLNPCPKQYKTYE